VTNQNLSHTAEPAGLRLRLRPAREIAGAMLDGAWWPTSADPVDELLRLLPALDEWGSAVSAVALSVAGWDSHPAELTNRGLTVSLTWLRLYHDLLVGTCLDSRRVRLLVIPSGSGPDAAAAAMVIALDPSNHTPAPGILSRAGCRW
jgi:uncharacterized protein DUF5994